MGRRLGIALVVCIGTIAVLVNVGKKPEDGSAPKTAQPSTATTDGVNAATVISSKAATATDTAPIDGKTEYMKRLERELASFEKPLNIKEFLKDRDSLLIGTSLFLIYANIYEDGAQYDLSSAESAKRQLFRQKAIKRQREAFPKLRDAVGPIFRQKFWELDIEVRTVGDGYRTVAFTGWQFAANKAKLAVYEPLREFLQILRFKRITFKWMKAANEYSYWEIESPNDGDFGKLDKGVFVALD
ncbi:hypothetical protein FHS85_002896 [Rhodoligotrophos appendicifer]|uniref:hypothetical protein n=1 Tax=Rhodoligotrophos appendicifer TaxID=987056 RepID=UPI001184B949|nr:hypothetical protein [Rhodoligotrophos appendicifer]